jgi:hypothetical protein
MSLLFPHLLLQGIVACALQDVFFDFLPTFHAAETSASGAAMGGVGLVFYRDPGTPYLLVKEVVPDGPAFRSSLIYPGDRLVAINDFDLAWSGSTPRSQQPQLPGKHGTAVTLTFDRTGESSPYPDRFNVTLVRDSSFYPDRLSSSPYRPFMDHELSDLMKKSPEPSLSTSKLSAVSRTGSAKKSSQAETSLGGSASRYPPWETSSTSSNHRGTSSQQHAYLPSSGANLGNSSGQRSANSAYEDRGVNSHQGYGASAGNKNYAGASRANSSSGHKDGYGDRYTNIGYVGGGLDRQKPQWDNRQGTSSDRDGGGDDLDDLIQEIARNDQILELQSKLNAAEIEHERRVKDLQRNQAGLEELVRNMRVELESSRDQVKTLQQQLHRKLEESSLVESRLTAMKGHEEHIRDLQAQVAKERVQRQAAERRIAVERDSAVQKMQALENDMRNQIRSLEGELDKEREVRAQVEVRAGMNGGSRTPDTQGMKHLQIERDALAAQNQKLESEIKDLRNQLQEAQARVARAIQQRDEHTYTQTHSYTRALEENKMLADQVRGLEKALTEVTRKLEEQNAAATAVASAVASTPAPVRGSRDREGAEMDSAWDIPGLQAGTPNLRIMTPPPRESRDVELHQSPSSARVSSDGAARHTQPSRQDLPPAPAPAPRDRASVHPHTSHGGDTSNQYGGSNATAPPPRRIDGASPRQRMDNSSASTLASSSHVNVNPSTASTMDGSTAKGPIYVSPHHATQHVATNQKEEEQAAPPPSIPAPHLEPAKSTTSPVLQATPNTSPPQLAQAPPPHHQLAGHEVPQQAAPVQQTPQEHQHVAQPLAPPTQAQAVSLPPSAVPPQTHTSQPPQQQLQQHATTQPPPPTPQQMVVPQVSSAPQAPTPTHTSAPVQQQAPPQPQQQAQPQQAQPQPQQAQPAAAPGAPVVKAGIGMSFQADPSSHQYIITEVHPSGPAGIAVSLQLMVIGDALLAVNGVPVDGKNIPEIVSEILGPEHTPVQLTISRMHNGVLVGRPIIVELVRVRPGTISPTAQGIARVLSEQEVQQKQQQQMQQAQAQQQIQTQTQPPAVAAAAAAAGDDVQLPPGWVQETDPSSGRVYYVNHNLKTFSWARPGASASPSRKK